MTDQPFHPKYATKVNNCPYCGSNDINVTYEDTDDNFTTYGVDCDDCGAKWGEQHILRYRYTRPGTEHEIEWDWSGGFEVVQ